MTLWWVSRRYISMQPRRNWCCNPNNGLFYCHTVEIVAFQWNSQWWIRQAGIRECVRSKGRIVTSQYLISSCFYQFTSSLYFIAMSDIKWNATFTAIFCYIFNTFWSEMCRVGIFFFTILSAQFICVWKKMNRVGVRAVTGMTDALWMKETLPMPAYLVA